MKSIRLPVLVVSLLVIGVLAGTAVSQANFSPAKIGFVDVAEVFLKVDAARAIEEQSKQAMIALDKDLRKRYEELRARRDALDTLVAGTPEYENTKRDIDYEAMKLDYDEKYLKAKIVEDAAKKMNGVYTLLRNETANYATRNGLDAVYMVNAQQIEARSLEQLQLLVATRPVVYWNDAYDISAPVIEAMNE